MGKAETLLETKEGVMEDVSSPYAWWCRCGAPKSRKARRCVACAGRGRPRKDASGAAEPREARARKVRLDEVCLRCAARVPVRRIRLIRPPCPRCGGFVAVDYDA